MLKQSYAALLASDPEHLYPMTLREYLLGNGNEVAVEPRTGQRPVRQLASGVANVLPMARADEPSAKTDRQTAPGPHLPAHAAGAMVVPGPGTMGVPHRVDEA
jgi:hypothetical protein